MQHLQSYIEQVDHLEAPVICVVAGSGRVARASIEAGADVIITLNAGTYREMGRGSLAAFMPYANANQLMEQLLKTHILPHSEKTPVVAGVFASDPTLPLTERLARLRDLGVQGITNWPAVGFIDGNLRLCLEEEGLGIASEIEMLTLAKEMGFVTCGFALTPEDASTFANQGCDALILNIGLTVDIEDTIEKKNQIQLAITKGKQMLEAVKRTGKNPLKLLYGGSVTQPEDFDEFIQQVPFHGYAGGSVFERFPVMEVIHAKVHGFRSVVFPENVTKHLPSFGNLIGSSPSMKEVFRLVERAAPFDVNISIDGESGTGKELIASQIHMLSPRRNHPFITVNCGAIPDTLVESEFFGYEKGAFTGATHKRLGKFELANNGTLFLDEVADLSPHAQAALLRVIQQGEIVTLGGQKPKQVYVRIICASNQNLAKLVEEGKFRVDLYFRLSTLIIKIPPLRERTDDIPPLVIGILEKLSLKFDKKLLGITPDFMNRLKRHQWAGNVRELEQVLTRTALMEDTPILEGKSFVSDGVDIRESDKYSKASLALGEAGGSKTKAAQSLGVSRKTLYDWMRREAENLKNIPS